MDFVIRNKPAKRLIGMAVNVTLYDVQHEKTTLKLSETFLSRRYEIVNEINNQELFGISTDPADYNPETDPFEFFIGVEVPAGQDVPEGMVYREIPAHTYVVFTFHGHYDNAGKVHAYLYSTWLAENGYELADSYNIEVYDERHHGPESDASITDIYFPIRKK